MKCTRCSGLLLLAVVAVPAIGGALRADESSAWKLPPVTDKSTAQNPSVGRLTNPPVAKPEGPPKAASGDSNARGPEAISVYSKVAPAIVYVTDGETGHGTGFFISSDGWVITNNHVVDHMPYSAKHGSQVARIVYGKMSADGAMEVVEGYLDAIVYRRDPQRDLALLKVIELPASLPSVPFIKIAEKTPVNGTNCFAIGHPSSGLLWTLRVGVVSGRGRFPHDYMFGAIGLRGADAATTKQISDELKDVKPRLVTLSSCAVNSGDSGGPLLNEAGELIAVTYAVPARLQDKSFAYHVHLDEVHEFLKNRPTVPEVIPPSVDFESEFVNIEDADGDGEPDARVFLAEENGPVIAVQIDLDQSSASKRRKGTSKLIAAESNEDEVEWDHEFSVQMSPTPTLFYDTDDDGEVDLIVQPQEEGKPIQLKLADGKWTVSEATCSACASRSIRSSRLRRS